MNMDNRREMVVEAAALLKSQISDLPDVGLLTGTGLGDMVASLNRKTVIPYRALPHFSVSTVPGHIGQLIFGYIGTQSIVAMQGRFHLYEGYTPFQVTFPVRVMQELGVKTLILTNAAGGLNLNYKPGDLMIITDHINLTGENPLIGPNDDQWGLRFPDMSRVYEQGLISKAHHFAKNLKIPCHLGVYAGLKGPSLETPAETRFLKTIGADAVGFSTVQEAIAAVHAGMNLLGISILTNINDPDQPAPTTVEAVIDVAQRTAPKMAELLAEIVAAV